MLKELMKDHDRSHCYAIIAGQSYLPGDAETILFALNQSGKNLHQRPPWQRPSPLDQASRIHGKARSPNLERRRELMDKLGIHDN